MKMTSGSEKIEQQLRNIEYCVFKPDYPGGSSRANFSLALSAARAIKRQRKEIEELLAELAYHGIYPKEVD